MTVNNDITEDFQYDISYTSQSASFQLTDIAYDLSINNIPFILKIDNQNPYRRETAQYKKEQFDNSTEPGEQSLTGWWIRSQTSWHNGAGIEFYEPGTDYEHVSHRFYDSRGIDIWNIGELRLLKDVFHSYTGANGILAVAGQSSAGTNYIVSGDSAGYLKKLTLNGNSAATVTNYTLAAGHTSGGATPNLFKSVTSDGTRYFAACDVAIHAGNIDGTGSDVVIHRHSTGGVHIIKFTKGYLLFGEARSLYVINDLTDPLTSTGHSTSGSTLSSLPKMSHENPNFVWSTIEGGNKFIYAGGYAGSDSEIWAIPFGDNAGILEPDPSAAIQVVQLPYGEIVNAMQFYLGYMAIGTNKGVRIARVADDGSLTLGPLLVETEFAVTGFVSNGNYIWASTAVAGDNGFDNAVLLRIDLSTQFDDGTFAYAYDLQYESDQDSYGTDVLYAQDRLHIVVNEGGDAGEIKTQHSTNYRSSGWLQTGKIRYGTVEPKFFKYLQTRGLIAVGDSIAVQTIDSAGNEYDIVTLENTSIGESVPLLQPSGGQEFIAIKYTLNNGSPITDYPVLQSYQLKSIPGVPRQRMYQYPLSCYDVEMDRYNSQFGYVGRAYEIIEKLENLEVLGDFVTVKDYRTNESFQGVIEEVRFTNESSSDKDSNGFGGLLLITVRKL